MSNFDKIVKLACKPKNAPPKSKYVDALISATFSDDGSLNDIGRALSLRLREPNAVIVFKALITLHMMMRAGSTDNLLECLSKQDVLRLRNVSNQTWDGYTPPSSMTSYAQYLDTRIRSFKELKHDLVQIQTESNRRSDGHNASAKTRRLRHLSVEKGLLREVKQVQKALDTLIQCKFFDDDLRDENTVIAYRMLIKDLLILFQAGNEGVCNILEHYFEMSKVDATESFDIYKSFIKQTDSVVDYLGVARKLHNVVNVPVPNLKHAPTGLVKALEEYLNDPNFENNRLEYKRSLGVVEGKSTGRDPSPVARNPSPSKESKPAASTSSTLVSAPAPPSPAPPAAPPGASQKIQDFFDSIQSDHQPTMFGGPAQQPYAQMTLNQQPAFNPFRQSMMMPQQTGFMQPQMTGFPGQPYQPQHQQQPLIQPQMTGMQAFGQQSQMGGGFIQPQQTGFIQPQQTGFLQPQATGSNPFRQSMMLNTSIGPSGAMSQPSSPFGSQRQSQFGTAGSNINNDNNNVNGFGQIQRPGSTPAFASPSKANDPKPLVAQTTGSKNPFAPAGGVPPPPVPQLPKGQSMNEILMGSMNRQGQMQGQNQGSPWGNNGFGGQSQAQPQAQGHGQANGSGSGSGVMSDLASAFAFDGQGQQKNSSGSNDFMSQFGSLSMNGNGSTSPSASTNTSNPLSQFGGSSGLSSNPTGTTSFSSQPTGAGGAGFLQPQATGFGGSSIKPFKPSSNFGSQLMETLPPIHEPTSSSSPSATSGAGIQSQSTGFPGFNQNQTQNQNQNQTIGGIQGLSPQMTGQNPFRQSMFSAHTGTSNGIGGMNAQPTGFGGGAFGANSPFAGQNQNKQPGVGGMGMGMGQFGAFGQQNQGQGQQQQQQQQQFGSLI